MSTPLTAEEARVAGALAEKQLATPQYYPLTRNALLAACNQSNNRDPVVSYDDATVETALGSLREKGFARLVHPGAGSRVTKYRQVLDEALGLDARELAIVAVLLLRGPQTVNELRARTERMADFADSSAVLHDLERLATRDEPLVARLGRQPGQREERFACTLAPFSTDAPPGRTEHRGGASSAAMRPPAPASPRLAPLEDDELDDDQRELLVSAAVDADNLFATLARHPGLLRRWLPFGGKLLRGGKLTPRHRELAILRTAYLTGAAYEWGHHVQIAEDEGVLSPDELDRVASGPGGGWGGSDALVLRACDELHTTGVIGDETWSALAAEFDERQLIELPMVVGHYRMLAGVVASLGIQPEAGLAPLPPA